MSDLLTEHADCEWEEVPPCVYCGVHNVRLYQGTIPATKDPARAAKRAACAHPPAVVDEDGNEQGLGFYWVCADCGYQGWYE